MVCDVWRAARWDCRGVWAPVNPLRAVHVRGNGPHVRIALSEAAVKGVHGGTRSGQYGACRGAERLAREDEERSKHLWELIALEDQLEREAEGDTQCDDTNSGT